MKPKSTGNESALRTIEPGPALRKESAKMDEKEDVHKEAGQHNGTPSLSRLANRPSRRWSADDTVVTIFAVIGLGGGVLLVLCTNCPSIIVSFLFTTGISALIYRFLGGLQGTSFGIGALKLGGTAAFLVGVALIINPILERQLRFRLLTDDIAGTWHWVFAKGGWDGQLVFSRAKNDEWTFTGRQTRWSGDKSEPLFVVKSGTAKIVDHRSLQLRFDVEDSKGTVHLESAAPLKLLPAFRGELRQEGWTDPWGIMIYKWPPVD